MEFDTRPIPGKIDYIFTDRYMEAKVMEDFRLLNEITENYSLGYLSESCALTMLDILDNSEYKLLETAMEAAETLNDRTLEDALDISDMYSFGFVGEGVLPYKEIVKASAGESIYNAYTFERTWDDSTTVGSIASRIADSKEANLKMYRESEGTEGFDGYERNLYKAYPDDRVPPEFLYERVIDASVLSGAISLEDGFMLKQFVESRFAVDESVASLMPVVPLTGITPDTDLSNTNVKDMVASTDSEINSNEEEMNDADGESDTIYGIITTESAMDMFANNLRWQGAFLALEGVIYKNNIVFDSETRKIFDKIKKDLKLSNPEDDASSFKKMINIKKNRYTFNFANQETNPDDVVAAICSCGFKPIKENGIVVRYEKVSKGIKITAEFTSIDNGVIVYYEAAGEVVKESTLDEKLDFAMDCDASDVKDAAKRVKKLRDNKDTSKDDFDSAVDDLDHAIENYMDVKKIQKEVKESADDMLTSFRSKVDSHYPVNEWLNDILTKKSSDSFVDDRKVCIVESVSMTRPHTISNDSFGRYFVDILSSSPSTDVFESCCEMLERIFDSSKSPVEFTESVNKFIECLENQEDVEVICETVLNNIEFIEESFMESERDIDEDIKPTINLLERLGYGVKYSCSGHNKTRIKEDNYRDGVYHGKLYTTARLTFDKKYNFKSIPDGWYSNKNSDTTSIYVRAFTYNKKDGTPNEAFEKWKTSYMKSLKDWAENLDTSNVNDEESKMEAFEELSDNAFTDIPVMETGGLDFDSFIESEMAEFM